MRLVDQRHQSMRAVTSCWTVLSVQACHVSQQIAQLFRQPVRQNGAPVQSCDRRFKGATVVLEPPCEAFEEHQTKGVYIGGPANRLAEDLLGSEVGRGADERASRGVGGGVQKPGDAEVREMGPVPGIQENVGRLDVSMDDSCFVCVSQRMSEVRADCSSRFGW
ncbi:hypothetical protein ADK82_32195 [Streptomyces sp. NRRL S-4]|nr:hypothetical protein ADK82_32195 [Streptomyces sp. NRRL S-4]